MADPTDFETETIDNGKYARDRQRVAQGFWPKLRRIAGRVPFVDELLAAYYCAVDPASPLKVKVVLMGALAYFVLPFDTVPDFLALFGFADDAAVVYAAIKTVAKHITTDHRAKARSALERFDT
ncbi:YkvA family protein [Dongia sp.]|uniref:YkvA family protein n=1 Tax=Dongia sp. TaxID=1977262 RepID=UPI0035AE6096